MAAIGFRKPESIYSSRTLEATSGIEVLAHSSVLVGRTWRTRGGTGRRVGTLDQYLGLFFVAFFVATPIPLPFFAL